MTAIRSTAVGRLPLVRTRLADGTVELSGFRAEDAAAHLAGEDDEHFHRFRMPRSTPESVRRTIRRWQRDWRVGGATRAFAVRRSADGALVGGCELRMAGRPDAELSYWIFAPYRRRGHGTRAVQLLCTWAFENLELGRIHASVEPDNLASRSLLEAAGFARTGEHVDPEGVRFLRYRRSAPPLAVRAPEARPQGAEGPISTVPDVGVSSPIRGHPST